MIRVWAQTTSFEVAGADRSFPTHRSRSDYGPLRGDLLSRHMDGLWAGPKFIMVVERIRIR